MKMIQLGNRDKCVEKVLKKYLLSLWFQFVETFITLYMLNGSSSHSLSLF